MPSSNYTASEAEKLHSSLDTLKSTLNALYRDQRLRKDQVLTELSEKMGGDDNLLAFKQRHYNEALATYLLKKTELKQLEFTGTRFLQRRHPVYQSPLSNWGRAHFYSPEKKIAGWVIPTPLFNVLNIWLVVGILYVTLYYDLLRKAINLFEKFRLKRLNQRLQQLTGL
jgi:hypothetical protein